MGWLAFGVLYSVAYALVGSWLRAHSALLPWFRIAALLVPPLAGVWIIARRRHSWSGCHWLFWATVALGLLMSAIGVVGWTVDEVLIGRTASWLGWYAVFALFGGVAPLLALLAQPHRGIRERVTATTAVDIAGIAVLTGFLYANLVVSSDVSTETSEAASAALLLLSELQQFLVFVGMVLAAVFAQDAGWRRTYWRLAAGLLVGFVTLSLSNLEIWGGFYQSASLGDVMWILPFAFYPWAAAASPASAEAAPDPDDALAAPSRPWIIFGGVALIPLIDYGLRQLTPLGPPDGIRDLTTAVTIASVLPLLMARLAVERAELRQADTELRLMAAAIEQADELILIMSRDGRIWHANDAFCRALGYTPVELTRLPVEELLAEESQPSAKAITRLVHGQTWRGPLVHRRQDGTTFQASSAIVPLADHHGRVTHLVQVGRDSTEELRLREQLIHSERLSAVGQLVSGVAHELNNPLQAILGFAELLIESADRPAMRRDLAQVRSEAIRAGKIVRNLLAFVRRSSSQRTLSSVNDIVRTTVALRSYELESANIRLEESYTEGVPAIIVNPEEIQQVVLNLVLNAEQAVRSGPGRGVIRVTTDVVDDWVVVEISDDGLGIPPALAGRIFEPFFSTKDVGEGTGLGLSIALGIARAHGGSLGLVPSPLGACFRLSLPAAAPSSVSVQLAVSQGL